MTACWAIRGATTVEANTREAILAGTKDLLVRIMEQNSMDKSQVAAVWYTTTQDLNAEYPAVAGRQMGWMNVAFLCGHEMLRPDSVPLCIRVLLLVNTDKKPEEVEYVYLNGAAGLRSLGLDE